MNSVDVCNQALALIGDRQITRLDDVGQTQDPLSRLCAEFYETARQQALSSYRWSFAKKAIALSERTGEAAIGKFTYTHILPSDLIRLMTLVPAGTLDDEGAPTSYVGSIDQFEIVGPDVKTNYSQIAAQYIYDNVDPSTWSASFVAAVARKIASYLAGAVADNPNASRQHLDTYERVDLPNAQYYDAVQDRSNENTDQYTRRAGSRLVEERFEGTHGRYIDGSPIEP